MDAYMKYSQHKLAKAKLYMTEDDKKALDQELKNGELTSSTKSKLDSLINLIKPRSLKNNKGCFGSNGLNRKDKKKKLMREMVQNIIEEQKNLKEENDTPL